RDGEPRREEEGEEASRNQEIEPGRDPKDLKPEEAERLRALADKQHKLEEQTQRLLDKMRDVADKAAADDPQTAKDLRDAADKAGAGVQADMKEARTKLQENHLNEA